MNWAIREIETQTLVGYPSPLVFATQKEARIRKDKLVHQARFNLEVVSTELSVNSVEKIKQGKKRQ